MKTKQKNASWEHLESFRSVQWWTRDEHCFWIVLHWSGLCTSWRKSRREMERKSFIFCWAKDFDHDSNMQRNAISSQWETIDSWRLETSKCSFEQGDESCENWRSWICKGLFVNDNNNHKSNLIQNVQKEFDYFHKFINVLIKNNHFFFHYNEQIRLNVTHTLLEMGLEHLHTWHLKQSRMNQWTFELMCFRLESWCGKWWCKRNHSRIISMYVQSIMQLLMMERDLNPFPLLLHQLCKFLQIPEHQMRCFLDGFHWWWHVGIKISTRDPSLMRFSMKWNKSTPFIHHSNKLHKDWPQVLIPFSPLQSIVIE